MRNDRGGLFEPAKLLSRESGRAFGGLLERVVRDGGVTITVHNEPKLVVITMETYQRMAQAQVPWN